MTWKARSDATQTGGGVIVASVVAELLSCVKFDLGCCFLKMTWADVVMGKPKSCAPTVCTHTCNLGHACIHKHTLKRPEALRIWPAAAADVDNSISECMCVKLMVYSVCVNFTQTFSSWGDHIYLKLKAHERPDLIWDCRVKSFHLMAAYKYDLYIHINGFYLIPSANPQNANLNGLHNLCFNMPQSICRTDTLIFFFFTTLKEAL